MARVQKIAVEQIVIPEVRASSNLSPEQQEFFTATVKAVGLINEPTVREISPGKYELIAGKTRLEELKANGATEIDVKILEADERTALFLHLAENLARGSVDIISVARVMQKLVSQGALIPDLVKVLGKSETWVRRTLQLLVLPDTYQAAIAEGKLTPTHVQLALRMPTPHEANEALQTALRLSWNTSVFETFVTNRLAQLEAAKTAAVEQGVDYVVPKAEPEKLIQYKQCLCCGYRVPIEEISVQLVCKGCRELTSYITSQLGPWDQAKDAVFTGLQLYFGQKQQSSMPVSALKTAASQEKTVSEGPRHTP